MNSIEIDLVFAKIEASSDFRKVLVLDLIAEYIHRNYIKNKIFALLEEAPHI